MAEVTPPDVPTLAEVIESEQIRVQVCRQLYETWPGNWENSLRAAEGTLVHLRRIPPGAPPDAVLIAVSSEWTEDFEDWFNYAAGDHKEKADAADQLAADPQFADKAAELKDNAEFNRALSAALREAARRLEEAGNG